MNYLKIIFFFLTAQLCFGNDADSVKTDSGKYFYETIWDDIQLMGEDFYYSGHEIVNLDSENALFGFGIAATTASLLLVDEQIHDVSQKGQSQSTYDILEGFTQLGYAKYASPAAGVLYITGLISGSEEIRSTARLMTESLILSGSITMIIRYSLGRARPYMNLGSADFNFLERNEDEFQSMPSWHVTVAFSCASVLAGKIDRWWAYAGFYGLAGAVAYSRIYMNQHWASDVFLGSAIGTLSGIVLLNAEKERQNKTGFFSYLYIYPTLNGVGFAYRL